MIFLVYAREDEASVDQLMRSLSASDIEVQRDQVLLQGGDLWPAKIAAAIEAADAIVVVWSARAAQSEHVNREVNQSLALRKHIIPCSLDDTALPAHLVAFNAVDLSDQASVGRLVGRLSQLSQWRYHQALAGALEQIGTALEDHIDAQAAELDEYTTRMMREAARDDAQYQLKLLLRTLASEQRWPEEEVQSFREAFFKASPDDRRALLTRLDAARAARDVTAFEEAVLGALTTELRPSLDRP